MSLAELIAAVKQPNIPRAERHLDYMRLGDALIGAAKLDRAAKAFSKAVEFSPTSHHAYYSLGVSLGKAKRLDHAYAAFGHAAKLQPSHAQTHRAQALAASMLGRAAEAAATLRLAIQADPAYSDAHFELGIALQQLGRSSEALAQYDRLLAVAPNHAGGHANRGTVLKDLSRPAEANEAYMRALRINPGFGEVYNNLAVLSAGDLRQPERALKLITTGRTLSTSAVLDWDSAAGLALSTLRRLGEAARAYGRAYHSKPTDPDATCSLLLARMRLADWKGADGLNRDARRHLVAGGCEKTWDPLYGLAVPHMPPLLMRTLAERLVMRKLAVATAMHGARARAQPTQWPSVAEIARGGRRERLRIGFLSADYRWHVMGFLTLGLLTEHANGHGATQFDAHALSLAADDGTGWQPRFRDAVEGRGGPHGAGRFVDLSQAGLRKSLSAADIAQKIASLKLHILVDLNGYTTDERAEVLAFDPAPVIMHAIGYPGTLGASFVPYMLVDKHAVPPHFGRGALTEKLVLTPHSYQSNDHARYQSSDHARAAPIDDQSAAVRQGPPAGGEGAKGGAAVGSVSLRETTTEGPTAHDDTLWLVNFNQLYKASPSAGSLWCSVLRRSPRAKLWLLLQPTEGAPLLRQEIAACGLDARRRAAFASLEPDLRRHLHRTRQASLLVDTVEYGCHTTASDALWSGVPMVTMDGGAMAARVGRSLLRASGAGEGVVRSAKEYVDVAAALLHRSTR